MKTSTVIWILAIIVALFVGFHLLDAQSPSPRPSATPTPAVPGSGKYIFINLDQVVNVSERATAGVFKVEYQNQYSDVVGNPVTQTPVALHFVRMELAPDNTP